MLNPIFATHDRNKLPQCVELSLSEGQGSTESSLILVAEVRCGPARVVHEHYSAQVSVSRAELSLNIYGGKIQPNSRFGEYRRDAYELSTTTTKFSDVMEKNFKVDGRIEAAAKPSGLGGAAVVASGGAATRTLREEKSGERTRGETTRRVTAIGGNTWVIQELSSGEALEGLYIGSEQLCTIEGGGAPVSVTARISVQKKSFRIDEVTNNETGGRVRLGINKRRLLAVLAGKALAEDGDALVLCESEMKVLSSNG